MHEFCGENEHTNALTACARLCTVVSLRVGGGMVGGWGWGGAEILPICCALHHSLVLYYEWWPLWCCSKAGGGKEARGGVSISLHSPNLLLTSHELLAGRHERGSERERECARVSRVCAWIAPPHPVHRFCRRPCSDGENQKTDKPFFSLRFIRHHGIPDVTDRSFMSPALSPAPFISERLWHHGFGYGTYK